MLVRILEIPPTSGEFHFGGGKPQVFWEVDWFRDDSDPSHFATTEGRQKIIDFIKTKKYFKSDRAYLILHPLNTFTINYSAP
jgi:hypothetical protein